MHETVSLGHVIWIWGYGYGCGECGHYEYLMHSSGNALQCQLKAAALRVCVCVWMRVRVRVNSLTSLLPHSTLSSASARFWFHLAPLCHLADCVLQLNIFALCSFDVIPCPADETFHFVIGSCMKYLHCKQVKFRFPICDMLGNQEITRCRSMKI